MTIKIRESLEKHFKNVCSYFELDESEVVEDLIDNHLDEQVRSYGLDMSELEKSDDIRPEWSEEYLNSLGLSMEDF